MFGVPKHIALKMTIKRINVKQKTVAKLIFRLVQPKILQNGQACEKLQHFGLKNC